MGRPATPVRAMPETARSLRDNMNPMRKSALDAPLPALLASFRRSLRAANKRPSTIDHYAEAHGFPPIT